MEHYAIMLHEPQSDVTLAVLSSSSSLSAATIAEQLLAIMLDVSAGPRTEIPGSILELGLGSYTVRNSPAPFEIVLRDGAVWLRPGPVPRWRWSTMARARFVPSSACRSS